MNLRNCAKCGKMFNYVQGPPICDACKKAKEEDFQRVKAYIQDNPKASLNQIAEENNVKLNQIKEWIREERLMFTKDSPIQLNCEKCGAFQKKETVKIQMPQKDEKGGMRFL